ncbi:MAG: hypothetical protein ABFR36_02320 [Acidobacteriota bacterium]
MKTFISLLFSGITVDADGGSSGISFTLILILIIVALVTILLIRDKKIREKVKGFFTSIGRKIKNARIKSKIENEEKEVAELITRLGEKGFENGLFPDNSEELIEGIRKEKGIIDQFEKALAENEKKIEKLKSEHEIFKSLKKSEIEKEEKVKDPVGKKYKDVSRLVSDLKKESEENEKKITKIAKGIEKAEAEIDRLSKDELLDPEERAGRKEREEKTLVELNKELSERTIRETAIPGELSSLEKEEADLKLKLDIFEKNLDKLKNELKETEKNHDEKISELVKEKGHFTAEKTKSSNTLKGSFEKLGNIFDKERPENNDLSVIFIDIDRARERIKNLQSQIT